MSLKQKALLGVKWTAMSAGFSVVAQIGQLAILARFLDAKDFGLMALALFIIGISQIFLDMGVSQAIIYKQTVSALQLDSLFYINILTGIILYLLLIFLSPFAAAFYNEYDLIDILKYVGLTFLIYPFGQLYDVLLQKELHFKQLAQRDILAKLLGLIISVLLAVNGYGIFSLVIANLVTASASTVLLVLFGSKLYVPSLRFSLKSLKETGFLSFGLFQMGEKVVNYLTSNFDTLLIGKLLGMEALGIYNLAKNLVYKPFQVMNPIVTKVFFPVMAKIQTDIEKVKIIYLRTIHFLTSTNAPIYIAMIVFAKPIVVLLFGNTWTAAIPIIELLSISALIISIGNPIGSLQLALGRADMGFYWNLALLLLIPGTVWLGSFGGLYGVAFSLTLLRLVLIIPSWKWILNPLCDATFLQYISSFFSPVIVAILSGAAVIFSIGKFDGYFNMQLIWGCVAYIAFYAGLTNLLNRSFITEIMNLTLHERTV